METQAAARPRPLDWRVAGVLLGLLSTVAVGLQGPLGVSTAYVTTQAAVAEGIAPGSTQRNAYLKSIGATLTPEWWTVIGIIAGALGASFLWRNRARVTVPESWSRRFGRGTAARFAAAFAGGFLILFGARLAGGCTSGHVISGLSQLAVSGLVFAAAVFAAGIPVALAVYGRKS